MLAAEVAPIVSCVVVLAQYHAMLFAEAWPVYVVLFIIVHSPIAMTEVLLRGNNVY